jgi:hypothetical protein
LIDPIITPIILSVLFSVGVAVLTEIALLTVDWIINWFRNLAARRASYNHDELDVTVKKALDAGGTGYALVRYSGGRVVASETVKPSAVDAEVARAHRYNEVAVWQAA